MKFYKSISLFFLIFLFTVKSFSFCNPILKTSKELKNYNFLIIPGIFNEFISFYMTEYRRYLLKSGVPGEQIFRLNNNSFKSPYLGSLNIKLLIDKISKNSDKKIIIFSHSKGALETLYFLQDNSLVNIAHSYLIQGPLDGVSSYKIAYEMKKSDPSTLVGVFQRAAANEFSKERFIKFSRKSVRARLSTVLNNKKKLQKITFISSGKPYEELPFKNLKIMGKIYNDALNKLSDGVILQEEHVPYALNKPFSCIKNHYADHGDFVVAEPWNTKRVEVIRTFLKELLFGFKRN